MATVKAYTDIVQSKKLAKVLPLESADMGWYYSCDPQAARNQMWAGTKPENADIPCWSLTALLGVLPKKLHIVLAINEPMGYAIGSVDTDEYDCVALDPVDACYEMILKLKESNLL